MGKQTAATSAAPPVPPDHQSERDALAWAIVDHAAARRHREAIGLEPCGTGWATDPDQRREQWTGIRLALAKRAYEDATGEQITNIEIPAETQIPALTEVDRRLRVQRRKDEIRHRASMRRRERADSVSTPRRCFPPSRPRALRHSTTRSSAKSGDSGDDEGESEPPSARRCAACGADISHLRRGALSCRGSACRKAKSRGKSAPTVDRDTKVDDMIRDVGLDEAIQRLARARLAAYGELARRLAHLRKGHADTTKEIVSEIKRLTVGLETCFQTKRGERILEESVA